MDCQDYITTELERKRGQHLGPTERGAIQELRKLGLSYRAIARKVNCAHGTVQNELKRGTPPRKSRKGRAPGYSVPSEVNPFTRATESDAKSTISFSVAPSSWRL